MRALDDVDLEIHAGEFLGVVGSSGSGKSTLLNLLAGLDTPSAGRIEVRGEVLGSLSRKALARYRAESVGMVFQAFNLIGHRTAVENVELALYFDGETSGERRDRSRVILETLGLGDRLDHKPADLSGGEQQRVAIARALVKGPEVLFADEPTGNLDETNSGQIVELLAELAGQGTTVVMSTHDMDLAGRFSERVIRLNYGRIAGEDERGDR